MADSGFLERARQFFLSKGYPPHAAAALAANAVAESGGNTRAVHDQGTGVGIYGFRDPTPGQGRKTELLKFAAANGADPYAESTQLAFAAHELETTEKKAGDALKASKDYREATNATVGYLRPQGYTADNPTGAHNYAGRYNTGAALAGVDPIAGGSAASVYAGGNPDSAVPVTPTGGLLAGGLDTTRLDQLRAEQAATATAQAQAAKDREQDAANASLQKQGLGLLEQGQKIEPVAAPPPMQPMAPQQAGVAEPYQFITMPDFEKMLAQQRLGRRIA